MKLTQVIRMIEADILKLLKENGPMSESQLFSQTSLKNYSPYGWRFAIRNLLEEGKIDINKENFHELIIRPNDEDC